MISVAFNVETEHAHAAATAWDAEVTGGCADPYQPADEELGILAFSPVSLATGNSGATAAFGGLFFSSAGCRSEPLVTAPR